MRIVHGISVRDDRKSRQRFARELVFMQIALHQKRGLTHRRLPFIGFKIRVQVARAERLDIAPEHIRGFFHAHGCCDVHHTGRYRHISHAQRRAARGIRCLHSRSFSAFQTSPFTQQRAQVSLMRSAGAKHVTDEKRLRSQPACVLTSSLDCPYSQVPQGNIPKLANIGLPDARDDYVLFRQFHIRPTGPQSRRGSAHRWRNQFRYGAQCNPA